MYKNICITNRAIAAHPLPEQIARAAAAGAEVIIVREKDLSEAQYDALMKELLPVCRRAGVLPVWHSFAELALRRRAEALHLSMPALRRLSGTLARLQEVDPNAALPARIGASCHSVEEAIEAEQLGASCITISHIFPTDCKKGLKPRGPRLITQVKEKISIPVFALGGITPANAEECIRAGADGVAMMSYYMKL